MTRSRRPVDPLGKSSGTETRQSGPGGLGVGERLTIVWLPNQIDTPAQQ
jgi:hypothetical protein